MAVFDQVLAGLDGIFLAYQFIQRDKHVGIRDITLVGELLRDLAQRVTQRVKGFAEALLIQLL